MDVGTTPDLQVALQLGAQMAQAAQSLAAQARETVGRELSTLRDNHRALSAYLDTGSDN